METGKITVSGETINFSFKDNSLFINGLGQEKNIEIVNTQMNYDKNDYIYRFRDGKLFTCDINGLKNMFSDSVFMFIVHRLLRKHLVK